MITRESNFASTLVRRIAMQVVEILAPRMSMRMRMEDRMMLRIVLIAVVAGLTVYFMCFLGAELHPTHCDVAAVLRLRILGGARARYTYSSFTVPGVTYEYHVPSRRHRVLKMDDAPNFDPDLYRAERIRSERRGVPISMVRLGGPWG